MEEQNIQVYIEPSNIDYVIIKIKEAIGYQHIGSRILFSSWCL